MKENTEFIKMLKKYKLIGVQPGIFREGFMAGIYVAEKYYKKKSIKKELGGTK